MLLHHDQLSAVARLQSRGALESFPQSNHPSQLFNSGFGFRPANDHYHPVPQCQAAAHPCFNANIWCKPRPDATLTGINWAMSCEMPHQLDAAT